MDRSNINSQMLNWYQPSCRRTSHPLSWHHMISTIRSSNTVSRSLLVYDGLLLSDILKIFVKMMWNVYSFWYVKVMVQREPLVSLFVTKINIDPRRGWNRRNWYPEIGAWCCSNSWNRSHLWCGLMIRSNETITCHISPKIHIPSCI